AGYLTATNPYAPGPPPSPYAQTGPPPPPQAPITTPYNPYVTPAPTANPYANQYPQQPAPITYPYSPYAGGGAILPPHVPGPGMSAPVYYPPPPRQPLFKPDTIIFLKRLVLGFIIFGTLFTLLMVTIQALFTFVNDANSQPRASVSDQIKKAVNESATDAPQAEADLKAAEKSHPHDPEVSESQGRLYYTQAEGRTDPEGKATLYWQSAVAFENAIQDESDKAKKQQYEQAFIDASMKAGASAQGLQGYEHARDIREILQHCITYAGGDQALLDAIKNAADRIRA
ncbi:MAG TPA: hypothetical protein VHI52_21760, partial [Verrucomicrobiae bacterium]|nr:hypothetical protein [Verrucomicrobiae bacterium]